MLNWVKDKKWSDIFLPEIKRLLGETFICAAPEEDDAQKNTDLIVLKLDTLRFACRVRRYEFYKNYSDEFTIRCGRSSGIKTELTKIIEGWGNYFFYGFSNKEQSGLCHYKIVDLNKFRVWFNRQLYNKKRPWIVKSNEDNSSDFFVFKDTAGDFIHSQTTGTPHA